MAQQHRRCSRGSLKKPVSAENDVQTLAISLSRGRQLHVNLTSCSGTPTSSGQSPRNHCGRLMPSAKLPAKTGFPAGCARPSLCHIHCPAGSTLHFLYYLFRRFISGFDMTGAVHSISYRIDDHPLHLLLILTGLMFGSGILAGYGLSMRRGTDDQIVVIPTDGAEYKVLTSLCTSELRNTFGCSGMENNMSSKIVGSKWGVSTVKEIYRSRLLAFEALRPLYMASIPICHAVTLIQQ